MRAEVYTLRLKIKKSVRPSNKKRKELKQRECHIRRDLRVCQIKYAPVSLFFLL